MKSFMPFGSRPARVNSKCLNPLCIRNTEFLNISSPKNRNLEEGSPEMDYCSAAKKLKIEELPATPARGLHLYIIEI